MSLNKSFQTGLATLLMLVLFTASGCSVTLVQPYDEKLITDTEALFKKASTMVDDGLLSSPRTDEERRQLKAKANLATNGTPLASNPSHASQFTKRYSELMTDTDALILRALAKSQLTDTAGNRLQKRIEALIEDGIPSNCPDQDKEFSELTASLTVKNYIDLKCIIIKWKSQHNDLTLTEGTEILKRVNWELRRSSLFAAVLAAQSAETSKKK